MLTLSETPTHSVQLVASSYLGTGAGKIIQNEDFSVAGQQGPGYGRIHISKVNVA